MQLECKKDTQLLDQILHDLDTNDDQSGDVSEEKCEKQVNEYFEGDL